MLSPPLENCIWAPLCFTGTASRVWNKRTRGVYCYHANYWFHGLRDSFARGNVAAAEHQVRNTRTTVKGKKIKKKNKRKRRGIDGRKIFILSELPCKKTDVFNVCRFGRDELSTARTERGGSYNVMNVIVYPLSRTNNTRIVFVQQTSLARVPLCVNIARARITYTAKKFSFA
jgi:hypothetical protein